MTDTLRTVKNAKKKRGWIQWLIIALLVVIPAGYVVIAAGQSHDPQAARQLQAEMAGLVHDTPASVQRRIYQLPIPSGVTQPAYFESNSWRSSSLYVQFTTTAGGLDTFLAQLGISRAELEQGHLTITTGQAKRVGWSFPAGHDWDGVSLPGSNGKPGHDITVNLDNPDAPVVYTVSTITFH
ncbi:hypothetical protein NGB36_29790 [Streptomyces sp. RB6PN25]|uniref:Sugar kinase n=1 Tax=Streptomyces humicola TaxID=2953240 RepID=A0ABT1Q402_9ACTN|nr:hypothetical protein [Streptomyces humicola]MCQ4084656.1 hypothetical protein [Streptomyces humicola]